MASSPKRVTVLVGSPHKRGAAFTAAERFLEHLESFGDVSGEVAVISEYDLEVCKGCKACFERGEERCPLKDDRDVLLEKMNGSDGFVFASSNYSFNVPGALKVFLDRLGVLTHRPRFFGKTSSAIVVQGLYGARKVRKYLEFLASALGYNVVRGSCCRTLIPMTEQAWQKTDKTLAEHARRFHARLVAPGYPAPSLVGLLAFRMARTSFRQDIGYELDRAYYREKGWLESDYYYPVRLGIFKKALGATVDWFGTRVAVTRAAHEAEAESPPANRTP